MSAESGREKMETGMGVLVKEGGESHDVTATIFIERNQLRLCCDGGKPRFYLKESLVVPREFRQGESYRTESLAYVLWWDCEVCHKNGPVPTRSHSSSYKERRCF